MRHGLIITFSGIDGAGKSTQIRELQDHLDRRGIPFRTFRIRGGYTPIMQSLKRVVRAVLPGGVPAAGDLRARQSAFRHGWIRSCWIALALLDLALLVAVLLPLLRRLGWVVLCDRWYWDTLIDFRLHFARDRIERRALWLLLKRWTVHPDLPFLLWLPQDAMTARNAARAEPFPDPPAVRIRRYEEYERMAAEQVGFIRIDAAVPLDRVTTEIRNRVDAKIGHAS